MFYGRNELAKWKISIKVPTAFATISIISINAKILGEKKSLRLFPYRNEFYEVIVQNRKMLTILTYGHTHFIRYGMDGSVYCYPIKWVHPCHITPS